MLLDLRIRYNTICCQIYSKTWFSSLTTKRLPPDPGANLNLDKNSPPQAVMPKKKEKKKIIIPSMEL